MKFEKSFSKKKETQKVIILHCCYFLFNIFILEGSVIYQKKKISGFVFFI